MQNKFILCKIAVERGTTSDETTQDDSQLNSFQWNDKHWRTLFPLSPEILEKCYKRKLSKNIVIAFEEIVDKQCDKCILAMTYNANKMRMSLEEQCLLPNLFDNYIETIGYQIQATNDTEVEPESSAENANSKKQTLMQEYVTTALYDALYKKHNDKNTLSERKMPALPISFQATLCNYQVRTVLWLLQREQEVLSFPHYYTKLQARDGETIVYKHLLSWHIQATKPALIMLQPGGILADEMGLGKTVEMLALIVLNQRNLTLQATTLPASLTVNDEPEVKRKRHSKSLFCICFKKTAKKLQKCNRCYLEQHSGCVSKFDVEIDSDEGYICPSCWYDATKDKPLPAATTFIVTPSTIKAQWLTEIKRHIRPTLKVFDYNEAVASNWISPRQLASYDIVLTDYCVLRRELYHTSEYVSERVTRNEQRAMRRLSPLLMVQWWRVCLDEAQMAESNTSNVAAIVRQLPAVNRWAVTGTPIQRSIDDLCGLLKFIGFDEPITPLSSWRALTDDFIIRQNDSFAADDTNLTLVDVLQRCMWRTCKTMVDAELRIPPQTEQVHRIRLSNLEKLFYSEQHALCESRFEHVLQKHLGSDEVILKISPKIMKIILAPLLKIRQSCIIPVVNMGSGPNKNSTNVQQKQFLQPKDLHAHLKSTNEIECKTELRTMASSYNGMAAIYFMKGNYEEAIKSYEMVLRLARDYNNMKISVDSLLQIHALHNILQACYSSPTKISQSTTDLMTEYENECNALEWKYLEPYANSMIGMRTLCNNAEETLMRLEAGTDASLLEFITILANEICLQTNEFVIALLNRFHDEFTTTFGGNPKIANLQSVSGMVYIVEIWYKKVAEAQKYINKEFENLKFYTMNVTASAKSTPAIWREMTKFIRQVYDCHLSDILDEDKQKEKEKSRRKPKKNKRDLCKLCQIRDALNDYECLLFNKVVDEKTNMTEGLENPSLEVALIKILCQFLRTKSKFISYIPQMDKHWEAIECVQQRCKKLIKYWIEIEYTVKAYDELDMCKMRISLAEEEEEKSHFKILDYELDDTFAEQQMNLHSAQRQFAMKLARLKYITHLEADGSNGPCPICQTEDENRYAVLECGHNICLLCLRRIREYEISMHRKLCCPICRNQQSSEKIYYVTRTATLSTEEEIQIVGDYSTKITYIVRLILKLQREHAKDVQPLKILVFSQWTEILQPIATALKQNDIRHRLNLTTRSIEEFKNPQLGITCLLMPLRKGCNGLNLIEATHVFLVEPILNPGEEAQAIGRVHRFGQTRSTTVHRFIVCNTIEENIHNVVNAGKQSQANWEFKQMSVESLRNLFRLENDVSEEFIPHAEEPMEMA
ncbi:unnamed protein product [Ceratitis capitata]|uniref:(Mediterranean fruit fly) hypothetical protein n=1 Tax=Ceratitis capitata TaxID=7213 RepID=A0A811VD82_CERCA|nr:unnamed protein product [Ceratitis capitata]